MTFYARNAERAALNGVLWLELILPNAGAAHIQRDALSHKVTPESRSIIGVSLASDACLSRPAHGDNPALGTGLKHRSHMTVRTVGFASLTDSESRVAHAL